MDEVKEKENVDEQRLVLKHYRGLLRSIKTKLSKADRENIRHGFELADEAHKDMRRKSGEPYILHPIAVARIVSEEMGLDPTSIVCALLHDVVEDTDVTIEDIEHGFDKSTAKIVHGLTKISGVFDLNSSLQAENFRKLLLTITDDIRVILIKIADRLHNMRTMDAMPRHKQLKIASETLYLYAPLAHRMGLYKIKTELEDLSMKYTEAPIYRNIARKLNETKRERTRYIKEFIDPLIKQLDEKGIKCEVYGRPKSIFSIWNKMRKKNVSFEEVYDLFAIRVILESPEEQEKSDCWRVYSIITDIYRPNPDRLRDWISNPKVNGYEALHTTVMGPKGNWVEVQIRSRRMHEVAERGVAAHWKYKEDSKDNTLDNWLEKIQDLLNNPDSNAIDFINDFKLELFSDEVFVFTPKGDLKRLRSGATALDFAFDIHSEIGKKCIGAKVNHKLVPLTYALQNGDQVEVITSKKQNPQKEWLNIAVTSKAKSAIKQALREEKKEISREGKDMVEKYLKQRKIEPSESNLAILQKFYAAESVLDFYYRIANKSFSLSRIKELDVVGGKFKFKKAEPEVQEDFEQIVKNQLNNNAELLIMGESADNIQYKFATCCNPIPGDEVFGFITINDGIKIHRTNCPNAVQLMSKYSYRIVKTRWTNQEEIAFLTCLKINGIDDVGVVNKITNIITGKLKLNMRSISFDTQEGIFEGNIMIYIHDTNELEALIKQLKDLDGVLSVERFDSDE